MGKRSNFDRFERDYYPTPDKAISPLLVHLPKKYSFSEPCAGDGRLIDFLELNGGSCLQKSDIEPRREDIKKSDFVNIAVKVDYVITNPPWDRKILHPFIRHFASQAPTWLLFDSDWVHTQQSREFLPILKKIVSVGRVKWIEDSKATGKDNCAWHLFHDNKISEQTQFFGRKT